MRKKPDLKIRNLKEKEECGLMTLVYVEGVMLASGVIVSRGKTIGMRKDFKTAVYVDNKEEIESDLDKCKKLFDKLPSDDRAMVMMGYGRFTGVKMKKQNK